ncbi:MAG: cytochrome P450 [Myxococcales bacterium]|nr:cytochrome P450 [Myxococcales bacterium]
MTASPTASSSSSSSSSSSPSVSARASSTPRRLRHPPTIPTLDLAGHLAPMVRDPVGMVMRTHRECGDIARLRMLYRHVYMLYDAESLHHVLVARQENYGKGTRDYRKLSLVLGKGLLTSEGELWKRQRRIAQPAFRRKTVAALGGVIGEHADALASRWRERAAGAQPLDIARAMNALTLEVAGHTLFGIDLGGDTQAVGKALKLTLRHIDWLTMMPLPYPEYLPTRGNFQFWRAIGTLDRVVREIIDSRRGDAEYRADLLGLLMAARDPESGEQMSREQLRDEIMTMLLAGHETTANALAWTLMFYARYPQIADRVAAEVDAVVGDGTPDASHVSRLEYTHRTLLESMRLYPPAWMIARRAREADVIQGYDIPAGSFVYIAQYAVHRNPRYWPDPERYDPDRFLPERVAERPKLAYLPFAHGPRKCIGDHFAQMEAVIILATLGRALRFELLDGQRIEIEPSVTLRPRYGLRMHVTPR